MADPGPKPAAPAELDRRIFHLQTLYDFTAELSPVVSTDRLIEAFLLMVMGAFGIGEGRVMLSDRKSRRAFCAGRGGAGRPNPRPEEVEPLLYRGFQATETRSLAPMSVGFVVDPPVAFAATPLGELAATAALFTVDDSLLGLLVLGPPLGKAELNEEDRELLRGLTANLMVFLKNARAFETIQALNEDLGRANADLRRTVDELTEAQNRIRILELAKLRLKQFVQGEIERAGRFRPGNVLLIVVTSALLALAFNAASPSGIPAFTARGADARAAPVEAAELAALAARGEALIVDARPPELFALRHVAGAINVPAALFDVIYPMKLGAVLKPEQWVAVYGRTFSKRYDLELAERLLARHERVQVLAGGLGAWQAAGLAVAP